MADWKEPSAVRLSGGPTRFGYYRCAATDEWHLGPILSIYLEITYTCDICIHESARRRRFNPATQYGYMIGSRSSEEVLALESRTHGNSSKAYLVAETIRNS
jgi:hypothetical protein